MLIYFAYGSNMFTGWLRRRVASAQPVGLAALRGYELRFHKRSWKDGSGKCNVMRVDGDTARLFGVVFTMAAGDKAALDAAEGLGRGYEERMVDVERDGRRVEAFTYVAEASAIDSTLLPFTWYKELVVAGAREHGLPSAYVEQLEAVTAVADPDRERDRHARTILCS